MKTISFGKQFDHHRHVAIITICLVFASFSVHQVQGQDSFVLGGKKVNTENFNKHVFDLMQEVGVPGISYAIIENNKIVHADGVGFKNLSGKELVDRETIFEGASLSKTLIVYLAHQLFSEGLLELDKPMADYMEFNYLEHDQRYKKMTPRMILSHSSGIENWISNFRADTLDVLADPGTKFVYSGEGYHYLVRIFNKVLEQRYDDYLEERVLTPLGLERTFTHYDDETGPFNIAIGHDNFGEQYQKMRNTRAYPASQSHYNAEDYAKLVIGLFTSDQISPEIRKEIVKPIIRTRKGNPNFFYGPGFEVIKTKDGNILSHGGNNEGFKNMFFYSPTLKKGFVYFSNSDRGKLICEKFNEITVGLDIHEYLSDNFYSQYPSPAIDLLNLYVGKWDMAPVMAEMDKLKKAGKLTKYTLSELGDLFMEVEPEASLKFLKESISLFPDESTAYYLLGFYYQDQDDYQTALNYFKKAKEMNHDEVDVDFRIAQCEEELANGDKD